MTGWRACLAVLLALLGTGQSCANSLVDGGSAKVISVVDGDTVLLDSRIEGSNEVRLLAFRPRSSRWNVKAIKNGPWPTLRKQSLKVSLLASASL